MPEPANISPEQVENLRRHKIYANLTLLGAAAGWAAAQFVPMPAGIAGYLQAGGEAGLIGGLADWFAVTALFRHPLGLPIPHTNLVPRNQARIAEGVARYIDNEFLRREMLIEQVRKIDVAERIAGILREPRDRARLVDAMLRLLPGLLRSDETALRQALASVAHEGLRRADLRPTAARLLRGVVESPELPHLIHSVCEHATALLEGRREWIAARVGEQRRWFIPRFIDRHLTERFISGVIEHLETLQDAETDEGRGLRLWLMGLPELVERSEGIADRLIEALKRALSGPELGHMVGDLWAELRDTLIGDIESPGSRLRATLDLMAGQLAEEFNNPPLRREINASVEALLADNVPVWRERIRTFISETLTRQPPREFARRLEFQVGPDLQFIRINGTIVGCLVGLAIHYVNTLL